MRGDLKMQRGTGRNVPEGGAVKGGVLIVGGGLVC